jgi:hypothetical protein
MKIVIYRRNVYNDSCNIVDDIIKTAIDKASKTKMKAIVYSEKSHRQEIPNLNPDTAYIMYDNITRSEDARTGEICEISLMDDQGIRYRHWLFCRNPQTTEPLDIPWS